MKIMLIGGAGFIGTNLAIHYSNKKEHFVTVVDKSEEFFRELKKMDLLNTLYVVSDFSETTDFDSLVKGQDVIFHLVSTTVPSTSNKFISEELKANVVVTAQLLEACVRQNVQKVVFLSSGGTVYGVNCKCPINETADTLPISSYGIQKATIEKLLYLYNYMYGLDYRVIRLANPYGPYQRPNGILGAVTTFTYKALKNEPLIVYGDGSVVRDFIYIDDAIRGIVTITENDSNYKIYNLGCGTGTSIKQLLEAIKSQVNCTSKVEYVESRKVDVPENFLDISRYEESFGSLNQIPLVEGIRKTADFLKKQYDL